MNIIQFFGITKRQSNLDNENYIESNFLLVLEYADSGTLRNYLKDNFHILDWDIKLKFAIQIADAVSSMHKKNIIHRDLHSDNILVHQNMIKLTDFGLSPLMFEISNGKRETPISDTPSDYIDIYTKCWKDNPDDRLDMEQEYVKKLIFN
ncbi:unnamed protein product [Rhizophagus irregularis]|nr:unnamed protein product [Rhizophagus irregularis]